MVEIIGAKGLVQNIDVFLGKIQSISEEKNIVVQVFDADLIYGKEHLISAYNHAKRAFDRGTNTTNSLEMEILLYASGERQLKLAIPKMGVKEGEVNIALIFGDKFDNSFLEDLCLERDDKVLEGDINTLKKFGINTDVIQTVSESKQGHLILEKIALVDIIK